MAWNEPGNDNKNDRDPWSGKPKKQGPTDLDKILSDFQKKVSGVIGNKDGKNDNTPTVKSSGFILIGLLIVISVIWLFLGFFKVQEAEKAVVLRFGKYIRTEGPGLHWIPFLIEKEYRVDVQQIDAYTYSANMLTKDENIIAVGAAVQFRRADPEDYLFNVTDPEISLEQATASALRQTVGNMKLDEVLTRERIKVSQDSEKQLKILLKIYGTGIEIVNFTLDTAKPPEEVQEAFDDVIKAGQDKERFIKKAQAYAAQVTTEAQGQQARILADANAYGQQVTLNAEGEVARFLALLPEYKKTPEVTRERLYLSAIENVLRASTKVIVDLNSSSVVYLPLEKLIPMKNDLTAQDFEIKTDVNLPQSPTQTATPQKPGSSTENRQVENNSNRGYLSFTRGRQGYSSQESQ